MKYYGQSLEDKIIHEYFGDRKGLLFDIGANNGEFLSNSLAFINMGWDAHLFEPSSVFKELHELHKDNDYVMLNDFGLSNKSETVKFWESENHIPNGTDRALVSTTIFEETKRWTNVVFHEKEITLTAFNDYWNWINNPKIDYITMDIEGAEWKLLQSIDLEKVGCDCLCIEFNGVGSLAVMFSAYCNSYGLYEIHRNSENIIFCRPKEVTVKPQTISSNLELTDSMKIYAK